MSLAQQRFLEGFVEKCAALGITDQTMITSLLEKAAKDALKAVEESYKKQGKSPSKIAPHVSDAPQTADGTYSGTQDALCSDGVDKSKRYTQTT